MKKPNTFLYKLSLTIYIITLIFGFFVNLKENNWNRISMCIVAIFTPLLIPFIFHFFKWQMNNESKVANIVFVYFASLIGSGFGGYSLPYFDKVLHFTSGLLATVFAILLFHILTHKRRISKQDHLVYLVFINVVNISIAALWEFFEYFMLVAFNNDGINHYSTGVHDSMTDMICAFVAGLILTFSIMYYYSSGKTNFFIRMADDLCKRNIKN